MTTPLQLPDPPDVPLSRSPLTLVACQVRHEQVLAASETRHGLGVQEALGGLYPQISQNVGHMGSVVIGPTGQPEMSTQPVSGWQMRSEDESWTVTLHQDSYTIETSAYEGWSDFESRLRGLTEAVTTAYAPQLEQRLGLRYVDEIHVPDVTSPEMWAKWIRPELLGPLAHDGLSASVRGSEQIVELDAGDGQRVTLRHGTTQIPGKPNWTYVLDHDCYRQTGRVFDAEEIMVSADQLHRIALQVFRAAITDEMYDYLEPEES